MLCLNFGNGTFRLPTVAEAAKMVCEKIKRVNSLVHVSFPLSRPLQTTLIKKGRKEFVALVSGAQKTVLERGRDIAVSTSDDKLHPYIILSVEECDDHPFMFKGLCWVYPNDPAIAKVAFVYPENGESPAVKEVEHLLEKSWQVAETEVERLLNLKIAA